MLRYACIVYGFVSFCSVIVRNEFKVLGKLGKCTTPKQYSESLFFFHFEPGSQTVT